MAHRELVEIGEWYSSSDHVIYCRIAEDEMDMPDYIVAVFDPDRWSKAQVHRIADKRNKFYREAASV